MNKYGIFSVTLSALFLVGCSARPIPLATSYESTTQHRMQAVHHWDVLAEHVALQVKDRIDVEFPKDLNTLQPPVLITTSANRDKTPFGKAFQNLLRTQLLNRGVNVVTSADFIDTLILDYDMQVVRHKDRRLRYPLPGLFSALMAGAYLLVEEKINPIAGISAIAISADVASGLNYYLPGETNTEVLINVSMTKGPQFLFSHSSMYYINTGDYDHYMDDNRNFQVVGCQQNSTCQ
jgi:hypothetical protein